MDQQTIVNKILYYQRLMMATYDQPKLHAVYKSEVQKLLDTQKQQRTISEASHGGRK